MNNKEFYTSDNEMGNCIFYSCDKLESLSLPAGTTVVGDSAFMRCTALSEITLPDGLKEIRSYAFQRRRLHRSALSTASCRPKECSETAAS